MKDLTLFPGEEIIDNSKWRVDNFSFNNFAKQDARLALEEKYFPIVEISDDYNRKSVSYQLSKKDCLHKWLKYKEGFSADLVNKLLDEFGIIPGNTILDPFLGSGTTSIVCQMKGINSIGYDILPTSAVAIKAKENVFNYDIDEISTLVHELNQVEIPQSFDKKYRYVSVTEGAYPEITEKKIVYYSEWIDNSHYSDITKNLVKLSILNALEQVSYTAKDGQYLRWDYRSKKMIEAKAEREAKGRKPFVVRLDKGELPSLKDVLIKELQDVLSDIKYIQKTTKRQKATIQFEQGSVLYKLPLVPSNSINGVITSPPYCNRYDYTRTYALELNYLGLSAKEITTLRQALLSCTVENKSKLDCLKDYYSKIGRLSDYNKIVCIIKSNAALQEVISALKSRDANGDINNKGILRMVEGYFTELAFLYFEIYRVCQPGSKVAFVNDNVRYAGEVVPVDFISTELATQIGFTPIKIYTLKQQKGNSSQQMKKFGRVALRKSITVWGKNNVSG